MQIYQSTHQGLPIVSKLTTTAFRVEVAVGGVVLYWRGEASAFGERPTWRGLPIPYVVGDEVSAMASFGRFDPDRHIQCLKEWLCSVCGQQVGKGLIPIPFERGEPPLHQECLERSRRLCPHLRADDRDFLWGRRHDFKVVEPRGVGGVLLPSQLVNRWPLRKVTLPPANLSRKNP